MAPNSPEDMHSEFTRAFNAGDVDALLRLYEPEAIMTPEPGTAVAGTDAIREALNGYLALKSKIEFKTQPVFKAGNLALMHGDWTLAGTAPDGNAVNLTGHSTEVLRRQPDGTWLYVIDIPDDVA